MKNSSDSLRELMLLGGGGHCRSCIDVIEAEGKFRIKGVIDSDFSDMGRIHKYPVIGVDGDVELFAKSIPYGLVTVGQINTPAVRKRLYTLLKINSVMLPTVISPKSYCSPYSKIDEGTIIMHGALINSNVSIGKNCIINSQALVEHDAIIADHCHISTGALINGNVQVGEGCFIGSGAILREGVKIGEGAIIGAGSIVLKDVAAGYILKDARAQ